MEAVNDKNILVGVTGGIAAYKSAELIRRLRDAGAVVRAVMTRGAQAFLTPLTLQAVSGQPVRLELLDSEAESGMDHIEFARWADLIVVAPATANFLSRLAAGLADDLLSTLCLASAAPIAVVPAMNHIMWGKASTQRNVTQLAADGIHILGPAHGAQACGENGPGRMLEPDQIISQIGQVLRPADPRLTNVRVMITAGPTWEPLDPVRGLTNLSSGKMGYALAEAFSNAGADVTLVSGPCKITAPWVNRHLDVVSARDMYDAVHQNISGQEIFIGVAAVADYRPGKPESHKIKKQGEEITLSLVRNPDILASVATLAEPPFCVGFAAETRDVRKYALGKLKAKNLKLIAANLVGGEDSGFNTDNNSLLVLSETAETTIGPAHKAEVSQQLCNLIADHYAKTRTNQDP